MLKEFRNTRSNSAHYPAWTKRGKALNPEVLGTNADGSTHYQGGIHIRLNHPFNKVVFGSKFWNLSRKS